MTLLKTHAKSNVKNQSSSAARRRGRSAKRNARLANRRARLEGLERRELLAADLGVGDVAIVGFNVDGGDDLAIVALTDLIDQDIFISDNEPDASGAFTSGEGSLLWNTGMLTIPAGTVVTLSDLSTGSRTVSTGTLTSAGGSFNLGGSGDAAFLYQDPGAGSLQYLYALANATGQFGDLSATGLTAGSTAVVITNGGSDDGGVYSGSRSNQTSFAGYLGPISTLSNWTTEAFDGESILPFDATSFTVGGTGGPTDSSFVVLNEIIFDTAGTDTPNELIELRGDAGTAIPAGTYLLNIEGDTSSGFGPGKVSNIFDLSGQTFGANGYLVLAQSGNSYNIDAGANVVTSSDGTFNGLPLFSSDVSAGKIENATNSFLLVQSSVAPQLSDDVDANDDGVLDGSLATGWTLLDGVSIDDDNSSGDRTYAPVTFTYFDGTTPPLGYVARIGDSTGTTTADWVAAELVGTAPNFTLADPQTTPAVFAGSAVNSIGSSNPSSPVVTGTFVINEWRTGLDGDTGNSVDFVELYETSGLANATPGNLSLVVLATNATLQFNPGEVERVIDVSVVSTDGGGFALIYDSDGVRNADPGDLATQLSFFGAEQTLILAADFTGAINDDLDTDDDGVLDVTPWSSVADAITIDEQGAPNFDYATALGGSRVTSTNQFAPAAVARTTDGTGNFVALDGDNSFFNQSLDTPGRSNTPLVTITPTGGSVGMLEGSSDTFDVVLDRAPSSTVTITVASTDSQVTLAPTTLTFEPAGASAWNVPQTVNVTAIADGVAEGLHGDTLTFTVTSTDSAVNGAEINPLPVVINDAVTPSADLRINEIRVSSPGGIDDTNNFIEIADLNATAGVALDGLTLVTIEQPDAQDANVGLIGQVVSLDGLVTDGDGISMAAETSNPAGDPLNDALLTPFDLPGLPATYLLVGGFTGAAGTDLDTNDDGTLDSTPWTTVYDGVTLDLFFGIASDYGVSTFVRSGDPGSTNAPSGIRRVVDATGSFDELEFGDQFFDTPGVTNVIAPGLRLQNVALDLNEAVRIDSGFNQVPVEGGFGLSLASMPSSNVVITIDGGVEVDVNGANSTTFTFTPANFDVPQSVELVAVDDFDDEGDHTGVITFSVTSADTDYDAIAFDDLTADIVDNDSVNSVVSINEILFDPGTAVDSNADGVFNFSDDEFVEILNTGSDPISIAGWTLSDASSLRHTFAAGTTLAGGQAIVVFGGDTVGPFGTYGNSLAVVADDGSLGLSNGGDTVSLSDGTQTIDRITYDGDVAEDQSIARNPNGNGVVVTAQEASNFAFVATPGRSNTDNSNFDIGANVLVIESGGSTNVAESGTTSDSFTFALGSAPSAPVTVDLSLLTGEVTLDTTQLTFTASNFDTPQTVTVTAIDDSVIEGNHTDTISFALTSGDASYNGLTVSDVTVNITDDDTMTTTAAVINEFVADLSGSEAGEAFIEIFVPGATAPVDLSGLTLLEIEGDGANGVIDSATTLGTTDANGYFVVPEDVENGTVSFLLVSGFTGAAGDDLDTDDDGTLDVTPWANIIDSVATLEDVVNDVTYGGVTLTPGQDGNPNQYGGASRIPNGADTDSPSDFVRNDFFGAGIRPGVNAAAGDAISTPGAPNQVSDGTPGVSVDDGDGLAVDEAGPTSDTFDVVLDAQPTADVIVTLSNADGEITVDTSTLTFTPANWDTPQTVTVTAVDDSDIEGNHTGVVSFSATSADPAYDGIAIADQSVAVTDNDGSSGLAVGDLIINEIMQNPSAVNDSDGEYFEIFNTTANPIDVNGFTISDADGESHIVSSATPLIVAAGGYFVFGINANTNTNGGVPVDYQYSGFNLGNGSDEVIIADNFGLVLDEVAYDNGATFPDPAGASMELIPGTPNPVVANDSGSNWQVSTSVFGAGDLGTPGAANSSGTNPPAVTAITINDGAANPASRSQITSVTVEFDTILDASTLQNAFEITNVDTGTQITNLTITPTNSATGTTVEITFDAASPSVVDRAGTGELGDSLADGNYRLDIIAANISSNIDGSNLAADVVFGGQTASDSPNDDFFRLYGDGNGDGFVDFTDAGSIFIPSLSTASGDSNFRADMDANGDGFIDFTDAGSFFIPNLSTSRN